MDLQAIKRRHEADQKWKGPWDEHTQWQMHTDRAALSKLEGTKHE